MPLLPKRLCWGGLLGDLGMADLFVLAHGGAGMMLSGPPFWRRVGASWILVLQGTLPVP